MSFLASLNKLNDAYERDPGAATENAVLTGMNLALSTLLTGSSAQHKFETGARATAELGKKVYRVDTWTGRGPRYGEMNMVDLLQKSPFILQAQAWLDGTYGPGLKIFHHKLTQDNMFSLTVSWDQRGERADRADRGTSPYKKMATAFQAAGKTAAFQVAGKTAAFQAVSSPAAFQAVSSPAAFQVASSPAAFQVASSPAAFQAPLSKTPYSVADENPPKIKIPLRPRVAKKNDGVPNYKE